MKNVLKWLFKPRLSLFDSVGIGTMIALVLQGYIWIGLALWVVFISISVIMEARLND